MFIVNSKNLGLAGGLLWGLIVLLLTWFSIFTGYGATFLSVFVDLYPGYSVSLFGGIIGFIYGFIYAFVFFYLLASFYNFIEH